MSPELRFLAECCRLNFVGPAGGPCPAASGLNWTLFPDLARFHRVQGLAWRGLQQVDDAPSHAIALLAPYARSLAATNLAIARECQELLRLFEQAGVPLLFVKGLTVAALAYRSPMLKMGWDIDLLIDPRDLPAAAELLDQRGYRVRLPARPEQLQSWHGWSKESVWSRDDGLHVELHTSLADNPRLIPGIDVHSPSQMVEVAPGVVLPTLAQDELFAYLAVHGASSAWFRLKWISDFAALLHAKSAEDIEQLYQRSQQLGAARAAGQALLLADRLFGVLEPTPRLRDQLAANPSTRRLADAALRLMADAVVEPTERPFGTLPIHWTQFLLKPGLAFKASELRRQAVALLAGSG